jgi:hypothetical protein
MLNRGQLVIRRSGGRLGPDRRSPASHHVTTTAMAITRTSTTPTGEASHGQIARVVETREGGRAEMSGVGFLFGRKLRPGAVLA